MIAYHATRALAAVLADGCVRPTRLRDVYVFDARDAAERYAATFGYEGVVAVDVLPGAVVSRWRPAYAGGARVLRVLGHVPVVSS